MQSSEVIEGNLVRLFQDIFTLMSTMDDFKKSLTRRCPSIAMPVGDKVYKFGSASNRRSSRCVQEDKTPQDELVQCTSTVHVYVMCRVIHAAVRVYRESHTTTTSTHL